VNTQSDTRPASVTEIAHAAVVVGIDAYQVLVEAIVSNGATSFELIGLSETSVKETRVRVRCALEQVGFSFADKRVVVSLSPADVKKQGASFDLAIAMATLAASGECPPDRLANWMLVGELSLTGAVRHTRGVLPQVLRAKQAGFEGVIVPTSNAAEATVVEGIDVRSVETLRGVLDFMSGKSGLPVARAHVTGRNDDARDDAVDFSAVKGHAAAKRALTIAAAGGHSVLFIGPPGCGKTILARAMPGILPLMTFNEAVETTSIHSVAGMLRPGTALVSERPFRAPHYTASTEGIFGGGSPPRPGEVSLAHNGVLFLDELPEFSRDVLEGMRGPIDERTVTIVRQGTRTSFPASFMLLAAMNPCPCGYYGDPIGRCSCSGERVKRYRARISETILDRIDMCVALPPIRVAQLGEPAEGPTSADVQFRVTAARGVQYARAANAGNCNARVPPQALGKLAGLDTDAREFLAAANTRLDLSAREATKILRVARTIADLEGKGQVATQHLAEAIDTTRLPQLTR
jgi:magnesium chelatase family protein